MIEHRQNILGSFKYFGAAKANQFWTQEFATSSSEASPEECI